MLPGGSSWRTFISLQIPAGSAKQGRLNAREHLTALALQGPSPHRISRASAMLNKHIPEATSCLSAAGKSAAPFIFKLWLDEVESGIGEKTVYSGFS